MRRFSAIVVIALATLLIVSICSAQQTATTSVPNLIRYSGTLKDAQGAVLSSSTAVGVTFSIYKQQDGGAAVWTETQNVAPDANGQYNVILGSTTATGLPDDLFSQQEQRWLGVQVQGEAEQARVLLVSVPYAFNAHEAETLGGLPPSAFVQVSPSNATSTASTNAGSGTASNGTTAVLVPQSTGSTVAQDGSGWVRDGQVLKLKTDTDEVGIGTSTPKAKLEVAGNIHASGSISSGKATVTLNGNENAITVDSIPPTPPGLASQLYMGGENAAGTIPFSTIQVGIGTKALGITKLLLYDPIFPTLGISGGTPGGAGSGGVELTVATSGGFFSNFAQPGDAVLRIPGGSGNSLILTNRANGSIRFGTGTTSTESEKMTLLPNGNFGIGNNLPPQLFAVGPAFDAPKDSPFEVNSGGDMVFIKKVAYSWPPLPQPTLNQVLTVVSTAGGVAGLGWTTPTTGTGNVIGPPTPCTANYLTRWAGGYKTDCTHEYELQSNSFLGVNVGINPRAALDVNGQTSSGVNTTDTRQSYMIGLHPVLSVNPYGRLNLFVGTETGSGGSFNTFVGESAGTTAVVNLGTFVGAQAGQSSTSTASTFVGVNAGQTSTGTTNEFFGQGAGSSNTGSFNSFFGTAAGSSNTGNGNVFIGNVAGTTNTGGTGNTFVGAKAGQFNNGGSSNIFVGFLSGINNVGGNGIIDIGNQGVATDNGVIRIGTTQGDTWIQGIYNSTIAPSSPAKVVCVDNTGKLGTTFTSGCILTLQNQIKTGLEQVIAQQKQQIESLQKQNEEFQQRLMRLESIVANK